MPNKPCNCDCVWCTRLNPVHQECNWDCSLITRNKTIQKHLVGEVWEKEFEKFVGNSDNTGQDFIVAKPETIKSFIRSEKEKSYIEGKKEALNLIATDNGWEESREMYAEKLGLKDNEK